jgi:hypothetical protein
MSKYFLIEGYWIDTKESFSDYIVKEYDDVGEDDDNVFFYGMGEKDLQDAIEAKEDTTLDFVITNYKQI